MGASANLTEGAVPEPERVIFDALVEIDVRLDMALLAGLPTVREDAREEAIDGETDEERASGGCPTTAKRLAVNFTEDDVLRSARSLLQDRGTTVPSNELRRPLPGWSSRSQSLRWIHFDWNLTGGRGISRESEESES